MKPITPTLFLSVVLLSACSSDDDVNPDDPDAVTFWKDVAPIYVNNCVSCHQEGGIAPFALDNYDDAKTWAQSAKVATQERVMPPWLVTDDGSCGSFHDSRWMSDDDIATIARWVDSGAAEGTPRDDLTTPELPGLADGVAQDTPLFTPEIVGGDFAKFDEYRCFLLDPSLDGDKFITGFEITPGNAALVHHVLVFEIDPDQVVDPATNTTNLDQMMAYDNESPDRDGWPCYGLAGDGVAVLGVPVSWAPGMGVVDYPAGTGMYVPSDMLLVAQVHYNLVQEEVRGQSDSTTVMLRYEDTVERPGFFTLPDGFLGSVRDGNPASLAPGKEAAAFTWERSYDERMDRLGVDSFEIHGFLPHMHELGRKLDFEIVRADSSTECAGKVERWDYNWQLQYFYEQPVRLERGDRIRTTCQFDTRGVSEPVLPGWGTYNEMCMAGMFMIGQ